jgi:prepilin-type N-terminal cleavage/methylation domain-containing protein
MNKRGFTLIELLVAMSIGLIIMNVAFTALYFTRKFIRKGELLGAKNDAMQSAMLWCMTKVADGTDSMVGDDATGTNNLYPSAGQYRLTRVRLTKLPVSDGAKKADTSTSPVTLYSMIASAAPDARPGSWYMAETIHYDRAYPKVPVNETLGNYEKVIGRLYIPAPSIYP